MLSQELQRSKATAGNCKQDSAISRNHERDSATTRTYLHEGQPVTPDDGSGPKACELYISTGGSRPTVDSTMPCRRGELPRDRMVACLYVPIISPPQIRGSGPNCAGRAGIQILAHRVRSRDASMVRASAAQPPPATWVDGICGAEGPPMVQLNRAK